MFHCCASTVMYITIISVGNKFS